MTAGRHFLQIPGPSNVPDRILRAMDYPTMDHRGPAFAEVGRKALEGMKRIFKTESRVVIYPSSGTGAWEAALVNTLSPGDTVLMYETGHFAMLWQKLALNWGSILSLSTVTGAPVPMPRRSKSICAPTRPTTSRPSASCITRPRPAP